MTYSNGGSFILGNGHGMSAVQALAASAYPEPWYIRMLGPVQPGTA